MCSTTLYWSALLISAALSQEISHLTLLFLLLEAEMSLWNCPALKIILSKLTPTEETQLEQLQAKSYTMTYNVEKTIFTLLVAWLQTMHCGIYLNNNPARWLHDPQRMNPTDFRDSKTFPLENCWLCILIGMLLFLEVCGHKPEFWWGGRMFILRGTWMSTFIIIHPNKTFHSIPEISNNWWQSWWIQDIPTVSRIHPLGLMNLCAKWWTDHPTLLCNRPRCSHVQKY